MESSNERYICSNCGYIYNPIAGDPMNAISPATIFDELPEQWVCPMCYAPQDQFDPLD